MKYPGLAAQISLGMVRDTGFEPVIQTSPPWRQKTLYIRPLRYHLTSALL
jgi:hypothetical protein